MYHRAEYYEDGIPETSFINEREHSGESELDDHDTMEELGDDTEDDHATMDHSGLQLSYSSEATVASINIQMTASLLNLKDRHKMTQAALNDVTKLVERTCTHLKEKILQDVKLLADEHEFDTDSPFYKSLDDYLTNHTIPIYTCIGSAYQQKNYFASNLLYVVS